MSNEESPDYLSESDIAIISMAARFPKARNVDEFWQNLRDGLESISILTPEDLLSSGIDPVVLQEPNYVNAASVLDDVELFDADFFGFNRREAEILDPQQRIFLECAWEALESAGYDADRYAGAIGVYAGISMSTYLINIYSNRELLKATSNYQIMMANDKDHLPTRVSYKLNLKGPSINVQTTCSTSLVAVHLACQSLLNGESDMALAGGVSISVPQRRGYHYQEGNITSPDGHCRAFDAAAQGTIGGNGAGVVLLKRLADAIADGDRVHAVVKGSAVNNDGSTKVGYTAPSVEGQSRVIAEALSMAGVEPETISYIETHGTGTTLGDPIEIASLTKAFAARTEKKKFCALGSVKTNIGHLDAAAGVAGLIKTVLSLEHRMIPPSLHFVRPNPKIDFENSPFFVNDSLREWETNGAPRRAGVSSFGIGGTNAHVIIEESPARAASGASRPRQLLLLSAKTDTALEMMTKNLAAFLHRQPDANLADVSFTLQVGRKTFEHRRMYVCRDLPDACAALEMKDAQHVLTARQKSHLRPVSFMFPGQGAQYVNMGAELFRHEPIFRHHLDHCAQLLKPELGFDLRDLLYPHAAQLEEASQRINQTLVAQPALFVVEYALAQLWIEWGVKPATMIGHSLGEYVAACLSGVMTLEDALTLVATRGRLMQQLPEGAMLAVMLSSDKVSSLLTPQLSLAAINGPQLCVVSGTKEHVEALEKRLTEESVGWRLLRTSHAFHSEMMEAIIEPFTEQVKRVSLKPPTIPYLSNLTGKWITAAEATDVHYWAQHLRRNVRFADGIGELLKEPEQVLLEVGPGQTLSALAKQHPQRSAQQSVITSLPHTDGARTEETSLLKALGQLWLAGIEIDWSGFYAAEQRQRVALPTYPFERQSYWISSPPTIQQQQRPQPNGSLQSPGEAEMPRTATIGKSSPAHKSMETVARSFQTAPPTALPQSTVSQSDEPPTMNANVEGIVMAKVSARERLVAQQLQIMNQQLAVLSSRRELKKS